MIQSKLKWVMMLSMFGFLFAMIRFLPPLFQMLAFMVFPIFASGIVTACHDIERDQLFTPAHIFKGFSNPNVGNLFRYGLLLFMLLLFSQVISTFIVSSMGYSQTLIQQELQVLVDSKANGLDGILGSEVLSKYFFVTLICLLPILAIQFLAPIVLTFTKYKATQAIIVSFQAVIKNIIPIIVYLIILGVFLFVPIFIYNGLITLLFPDVASIGFVSSFIVMIIFFMMISMILALTYSSAYVAFKQIFVEQEAKA